MTSAIDDVQDSPAAGGLGMRVNFTDARDRVDVLAGIKLLWRMILDNSGRRRLLCSHRLWTAGQEDTGRTFAACVTEYKWHSGAKAVPVKGTYDHSIDALRYWAINARWQGSAAAPLARSAFAAKERATRTINPVGGDR